MSTPDISHDRSEKEIFFAALERTSADARAAFLDGACGKNPSLRARVEQLLAAHLEPDEFMQTAAAEHVPAVVTPIPPAEQLGATIGRYKLLEKLGEGGFGTVWLAEQKEPVRRKVALKIIKLGMDTRQVVARFEAERQALALMDHPNIAKVLDAGATDTGRPYFVMELVRGVKITDYCDQNHLPTQQRLDLFIKVCQAIQHAHQKGIIHRDIKPSNILVTLHDGVPVPKVIDFGIAKATQGELTDKTIHTQFQQFIGTPAYMSPEQAEMSGLDIDTRSDIYSLGVLLYELLTGQTPFDARELWSQGLDAMRRTIREHAPAKPSTRLATLQGEDLTTTARRRSVEAAKLTRLVSGDLDWIVMKCLEKDRARRYETANGVAADLQRHLNDEPVLARPPSRIYEFQRTVRRHKAGFAAAAAVILALSVGLMLSAWQAVRARQAEMLATDRLAEVARERDAKEQARQEAEAISKFLGDVFQSPDPSRDGRTITVAETLDRAAKKLETDLATQPERRAKLQATLGLTYSGLGLDRQAIPLQEKVRDYSLATFGPEHTNTLQATGTLATYYARDGRRDEALKLRKEVLTICRKVLGPGHFDTIDAMGALASSYADAGLQDEAIKLYEEVLAFASRAFGPEDDIRLTAMNNLALLYGQANRREEALKMLEDVLALVSKATPPEHPDTISAMHNLASAYHAAGRREEAIKLEEKVVALSRKVNGPEHRHTLISMGSLVSYYQDAGRQEEALQLWEHQLEAILQKDPGSKAASVGYAQLGFTFDSIGRGDHAVRAWQQAVRIDPSGSANVHYWLGKALVDRGRYAEAMPILRATQKFYPDGERGQETAARIRQIEAGSTPGAAKAGQPAPVPAPSTSDLWLTRLRAAVSADESDTDKTKHLATVLLWRGETNEHRALCRKLLEQAARSQDPTAHDRAAKASLILARLDPETLKLAVASGVQALKLSTAQDANRGWFLIAAAMAGVRDGRPAEAETLLNEALARPNNGKEFRGLALACRALARGQMNRGSEARADLTELEAVLPKYPGPPAASPILQVPDLMAAVLIRDEATALLDPSRRSQP